MTSANTTSAAAAPLLDRSDERYQVQTGIAGAIRTFIDRVRSGAAW